MHNICLLRVFGVSSYDEAVKVADDSAYELCSEYRPVDNGIDVVRVMKASDFLGVYLNREITNDECKEWLNSHSLDEIYENFNEEHIDNVEDLGKFLGSDFTSCLFVDEIKVIEKEVLYLEIHFDNYPLYMNWDSAYVLSKRECKKLKLNDGKTKDLSSEDFNKEFYNIVVIDASKKKNEYGILLPVYNKFEEQDKKINLKDTLKEYPINEKDYIVYLNVKY